MFSNVLREMNIGRVPQLLQLPWNDPTCDMWFIGNIMMQQMKTIDLIHLNNTISAK